MEDPVAVVAVAHPALLPTGPAPYRFEGKHERVRCPLANVSSDGGSPMKFDAKFGLLAALVCCCSLLAAFASTAAAIAPVQIEFKEPEKGGTFAFIDQAPKTTFGKHDQPM